MANYPSYSVQSARHDRNKCIVKLTASTDCGENIEAKATVRQPNLKNLLSTQDMETLAIETALRNLGHEAASVARSCKRRGTHKGHHG